VVWIVMNITLVACDSGAWPVDLAWDAARGRPGQSARPSRQDPSKSANLITRMGQMPVANASRQIGKARSPKSIENGDLKRSRVARN
jgi:hypothetical protein